jgi:hypothetical protein
MPLAHRWKIPACLAISSLTLAGPGIPPLGGPPTPAAAAAHQASHKPGKPRCPGASDSGAARKQAGRASRHRRCSSRKPHAVDAVTKTAQPPAPDTTRHEAVPGAKAAVPPAPSPAPPVGGGTPEHRQAGAPFRFFSDTSPWNEPLASDAPTDPASAAIVASFQAEISRERLAGAGPTINTRSYSVPIYTVPAEQPTVTVRLTAPGAATLRSSWAAVPLPADAHPADGSDGHLVLWQPSTDRLWEFWRLVHDEYGWRASWGGSMQEVSSASGVYGPEAWPGASRWWGASACSLSIAGGVVTLEDLERGQIDHALAIATPNIRSDVFALPAQRTDGKSDNPLSLPEGAHLRLNPNLDLTALHLPPVTLMLAEAAQRYGIFVRDGAPAVTSFYAQDPTPLASNPYTGPTGLFERKSPSQLAAAFPWAHLELLSAPLASNP